MIFDLSRGDGTHPRPQLVRNNWLALDRTVEFAFDNDDFGRDEHWERSSEPFNLRITLPFSPEAAASGIGDTSFHSVVWYRIRLDRTDLVSAGLGEQGDRILLHFGAVDYRADVWVDAVHVAAHVGGQAPFSADITSALDSEADEHWIVVRAEDDPLDLEIPRGKQGWRVEPHEVWYHRTTGIWRTVWIEAVPRLRIADLLWRYDIDGEVEVTVELSARPSTPVRVAVDLGLGGVITASVVARSSALRVRLTVHLDHQDNGLEAHQWLWSPESPTLLDADVQLLDDNGMALDTVGSYLGLRTVAASGSRFVLNDRPYFLRAILEQGYWPTSLFTPPDADSVRAEVELIKNLGFNCARLHQKLEDPRFLYWADRLGLMVWGEIGAAYQFSDRAIEQFVGEWMAAVKRDRSHPSVVAWVPFNESWGVSEIAGNADEQAFVRGVVELTRALDPARPIVSNDGWEHVGGDLLTIHDYEASGAVMSDRYRDRAAIDKLLEEFGPAGRRLNAGTHEHAQPRPVILSEFGGIELDLESTATGGPDYSIATDAVDLELRLRDLCDALAGSTVIAGVCYTQLTDTAQERNGLCDEQRRPKLPLASIRAIIDSLG